MMQKLIECELAFLPIECDAAQMCEDCWRMVIAANHARTWCERWLVCGNEQKISIKMQARNKRHAIEQIIINGQIPKQHNIARMILIIFHHLFEIAHLVRDTKRKNSSNRGKSALSEILRICIFFIYCP